MVRVGLDHVVIAVSDWERSLAFYRDVLGAEIIETAEGGTAFRFGDQQLDVLGPETDAGDLVAKTPVVPGNSELCFVWSGSVIELEAHLAAKGVTVDAGPVIRHGVRGRGRSTYVRDPDGSLLEFIVYED